MMQTGARLGRGWRRTMSSGRESSSAAEVGSYGKHDGHAVPQRMQPGRAVPYHASAKAQHATMHAGLMQ